jgi:hypothetical protein
MRLNEKVVGYVILILVAGATSVIGFYIAKKIENSKQLVVIQPSQYPDFDAIKGNNPDPKLKILNISADILVDYKRPLTSWDDLYFIMNTYGGHLISDDGNSLPVPPGTNSRYLYDLRSISYYPKLLDKEQKINKKNNINLFSNLYNGNVIKIQTSISSARPGRVIKEISIYYECAEDSDCDIEEVN